MVRKQGWVHLLTSVATRQAGRSGWVGRWMLSLLSIVIVGVPRVDAQEGSAPTPEAIAFFESRVRPLLVERCYSCHSQQSEKLKGGLLLDSRAGLLKGGDSGKPGAVPGNPAGSLLLEAVGYENQDLQMPPKGRLSAAEIRDLTEWVRLGAPWPAETSVGTAPARKTFDLDQRRRSHWAWRPIAAPVPPEVRDTAWVRNPVDRFILARLEGAGLRPAPEAEPRVLLRRLSFALTGLPPSPEEARACASSTRPDALSAWIEQGLASPRYGERWARHWLDLVRYAETLGHEFDYPRHHAWRYRDYVIRAFNADVPYDTFAREHIAGDLLPEPRRHPVERANESVIGTAAWWFGQQVHSPVDVRQHQADVIDNQIDVMAKTFLGLTVACARCHDHKFDAISTRDFYAFYGVISSSRYTQAAIDMPGEEDRALQDLVKLRGQLRNAWTRDWLRQAGRFGGELGSAQAPGALTPRWQTALAPTNAAASLPPAAAALARSLGVGAPDRPDAADTATPTGAATPSVEAGVAAVAASSRVWEFDRGLPEGWFIDGTGARRGWPEAGEFALTVTASNRPVRILTTPAFHSGWLSGRLQGSLRSPTFTVTNRFLHVLAAGRQGRIRVIIDNFSLVRSPIYGELKRRVDHEDWRWVKFDLSMWMGHRAYLECIDSTTPDPADDEGPGGINPAGWIALASVAATDVATPPSRSGTATAVKAAAQSEGRRPGPGAGPRAGTQREGLATSAEPGAVRAAAVDRFVEDCGAAIARWGKGTADTADAALLGWLVAGGLLEWSTPETDRLVAEYRRIENRLKEPTRVPAMTDGTGLDEVVFVRGNPRTPGPVAPRRFLEALDDPARPPLASDGGSSGRLELARSVTDSANPLFARVIVNRVWLHLFGRGLVPTPDDFGVLGTPPTHPELLDYLAHWFRTEGGYSIKSLIRLLTATSTYRMSSVSNDPRAAASDPNNDLFHRMNLLRLEGETLRDAMLAVSGRLDTAMYGPSVPTHLTSFMDGRGRPARSGPLDGAGRRSVYLEVRNNFLNPMLRAFDAPIPFTTVGRRTQSNVPAQSLILMNDPFVAGEAARWAARVLDAPAATDEVRIAQLCETAYSRPARPEELASMREFLELQRAARGPGGNERETRRQAWADLAHVIFNTKEFLYVP